jgi:hypothetical protein
MNTGLLTGRLKAPTGLDAIRADLATVVQQILGPDRRTPTAHRPPPSAHRRPPTAHRRPPTAVRPPPSAHRPPPSAVRRPPTADRTG